MVKLIYCLRKRPRRLSGLDEANFIDPSSTAYLVSEERTLLA